MVKRDVLSVGDFLDASNSLCVHVYALKKNNFQSSTSPLSSRFRCWLRYVLAQSLNYPGQSRWPWYPMGTLAANMLGTAIDFGLQALLTKRGPSLGYWGGLVVSALQTGLCGALTTVSTLVAEVKGGWRSFC